MTGRRYEIGERLPDGTYRVLRRTASYAVALDAYYRLVSWAGVFKVMES